MKRLEIKTRYLYLAAIFAPLFTDRRLDRHARYYSTGPGLNAAPWAAIALVLGLAAPNRSAAVKLGGVYGALQAAFYMWVERRSHDYGPPLVAVMGTLTAAIVSTGIAALLASFGYKLGERWKR